METTDSERLEELLSRLAEGALDDVELAEAERFLAEHPEAQPEFEFEKALVAKLRDLPGERAPADFAQGILQSVPPMAGSFIHRLEVSLRRLMGPSLTAATVMAAALLFLVPQGPEHRPSAPPSFTVASLVAGPDGLQVGRELLYPDETRALANGTTVQVPESSSASLVIDENVEVEVRGGTTVRLAPRVVHLYRGSVYVRVEPGVGNFVVEGPLATARVVGTEFEVQAQDGRNSVSVTEGVVEVRALQGDEPVQVLAGGQATVARSNPGVIRTEGPVRAENRPLEVKKPETAPTGEARTGQSENLPALDSY